MQLLSVQFLYVLDFQAGFFSRADVLFDVTKKDLDLADLGPLQELMRENVDTLWVIWVRNLLKNPR